MKQRIWELDAVRGVCILGMILFHILYDLQHLFHILPAGNHALLDFIATWGGTLFFLISGICATLGTHPVRRGLIVFGCGLAVSAVTWAMAALGLTGKSMIILFGVLHCLGVSMLLWPLFRKLPWPVLGILGSLMAAAGLYLDSRRFPVSPWLFPLGIKAPDFASADYFPLLPFFGFFLLGAVLGRLLYKNRQSLFPQVDSSRRFVRFFTQTGRWSLPIYLLHQPVITGILTLLEVLL